MKKIILFMLVAVNTNAYAIDLPNLPDLSTSQYCSTSIDYISHKNSAKIGLRCIDAAGKESVKFSAEVSVPDYSSVKSILTLMVVQDLKENGLMLISSDINREIYKRQ